MRREWQVSRDPALKRRLNAKSSMVWLILQTLKQDQWDQFTDTFAIKESNIYKLNKCFFNKKPATKLLISPNGLVYSSVNKAEVFANSLENQFATNPGPDNPEVAISIPLINSENNSKFKFFTNLGAIKFLIKKFAKKKKGPRYGSNHQCST